MTSPSLAINQTHKRFAQTKAQSSSLLIFLQASVLLDNALPSHLQFFALLHPRSEIFEPLREHSSALLYRLLYQNHPFAKTPRK